MTRRSTTYPKLTEAEVKTLVVDDKWMASLDARDRRGDGAGGAGADAAREGAGATATARPCRASRFA